MHRGLGPRGAEVWLQNGGRGDHTMIQWHAEFTWVQETFTGHLSHARRWVCEGKEGAS